MPEQEAAVRADERGRLIELLRRYEQTAAYNLSQVAGDQVSTAYWQMHWDVLRRIREDLTRDLDHH